MAALVCGLGCGLAFLALPAQKKNKEDDTQTLQLPKELARRGLGRNPAPHLPRHAAFRQGAAFPAGARCAEGPGATSGGPVLKIRAFVAGSGDVRRVRDLVSEVFTDRRQPLPALSLIQAGGLPLEGAQVVLEAIAAGKEGGEPARAGLPLGADGRLRQPAGPGGAARRAIAGRLCEAPSRPPVPSRPMCCASPAS